jgi:triacylglycerol lipase
MICFSGKVSRKINPSFTLLPYGNRPMIVPNQTVPKLGAPIVLVHGLFGFDKITLGNWTLASYFPGIPQFLAAAGNHVLVPRLSPTGGVKDRAAQLKAFLDHSMPREPVHIFAHSMGGLDSRYMVSRLGMAHRVLTLTTLGTPHRGSVFADLSIRRLERVVKPMFNLFGIPTQGFYDLTTSACNTFNEQVPDDAGVRYFSVAGRHEGDYLAPEWLLSHGIVLEAEGPNDGVVSIASATYGESREIWEGDHLSLVNWLHPLARHRGFRRDPATRYAPLVRRLADEGF